MNNKARIGKSLLAAMLFLAGNAQAAVITVNDNLDNEIDQPGLAGEPGVLCTLREAIRAANQDPANDDCVAGEPGDVPSNPSDRIVFSLPPGTTTIELDNAVPLDLPLVIRDRVEIDGIGVSGGLTIKSKPGVLDRFFTVIDFSAINIMGTGQDPDEVKFLNMTIRGASGVTAGVDDIGSAISLVNETVPTQTLQISNVTLRDNVNTDSIVSDAGGAIGVAGNVLLRLFDSRFYNNSAQFGGAVFASDRAPGGVDAAFSPRVEVMNTVFGAEGDGNSATASGGAFFSRNWDAADAHGYQDFINATFIGNSAATQGGAIHVIRAGTMNIVDSLFGGTVLAEANTAMAGSGGALNIEGFFGAPGKAINITNTRIMGNTASEHGGAIVLHGSAGVPQLPVTILNSTLKGNSAGKAGGAVSLRNTLFLLAVDSSTLNANAARNGGGLACSGAVGGPDPSPEMKLVNSTISGNMSQGKGGGIISSPDCHIVLNNVTVTANKADSNDSGGGDGGGISSGIAVPPDVITVSNSIVAGNSVGSTGSDPDCSGSFVSGDYNLIGNDVGCTGFGGPGSNDQVGTVSMGNPAINPLLTVLENNGGPTDTHALIPGSPAIDAGNSVDGCRDADGVVLLTDQRGNDRTQDGDSNNVSICDIGAYEVDGPPGTPLGDCDPAPLPGCLSNQLKAKLVVKPGNTRFKWAKGSFVAGLLGTPATTTDYRLCMYRGATLIAGWSADAGVGWKEKLTRVKYANRANPGGLVKMLVKSSAAKAKLAAKTNSSPVLPLSAASVLVQVVNSNGDCWDASFGPGQIRRDDAKRFVAKQ